MKKRFFALFCLFFVLNCSLASADALYLKNGKVSFGKVKEKGSYYVIFEENGKENKYYDSEIQKVEEDGQPVMGSSVSAGQSKVPREKRDLINKLLEVNGSKKALEANVANILSNMPTDQKAKYTAIFNTNNVLDIIIPLYSKYFTEEELKSIIAFYGTAAGQKLIEYTPKIMQETLRTLFNMAQQLQSN